MKLNKREVIQKYFRYFEGDLINEVHRNYASKKGMLASHPRKDGYKGVRFKGEAYLAHRLIWILLKGNIPKGLQIDHINRDKSDNRIENLRLVNHSENQINNEAKGYTKDKSTGLYMARIKRNGKSAYLGRFSSKEEAQEAYSKKKGTFHVI